IVLLFSLVAPAVAISDDTPGQPTRGWNKPQPKKQAALVDTTAVDSVSTPVLADDIRELEAEVRPGDRPSARQPETPTPAESANEPVLPGVSLSGFLDVIGSYRNSPQDHSDLSILEAEFDLGATPTDRIELAAAVTLEPETRSMELTAATVAFSLMSAERGLVTGATLTTGLFNPYFGTDCRRNNAECRKLATAPLVVELTHQSWTDVGVQIDLEGPFANFSLYAVNGFEPSEEVMQDVIDLATGLGDTIDVSPSNSVGTRLGIMPIPNVELGGSFAIGFNKADQDEMLMTGADLTFAVAGLEVRSEYIFHSINRSILKSDNNGLYVQPTFTLGRAFATARYDSFKAEGYDRTNRYTVGAGYQLAQGVEVRLETAFAEHGQDNATIAQVFVGF
ncbi:MAG: hypothetical protein HY851_03300, partial [candidate division Zixibacteria bacterium]|nr:hypothetical protein [candidate division Zixibacteria bacterium]